MQHIFKMPLRQSVEEHGGQGEKHHKTPEGLYVRLAEKPASRG